MRSTVAALAVAAAAAPSFVSALPRPQSGSAAISLGTIDEGVRLVGDAANAVPAIKSAWDNIFHRELDASTVHFAGPDKYTARIGTTKVHHEHDHHKAHHDKTQTVASAQPSTSHASRADSDGSEAISLSAIGDGLKLFGDAANAAPAIKSAWDNIFHRREMNDLMARDGSEAISLSTIDDGVKLVGDAANAVPAIKSAWDDVFHRRELYDMLARDDSDGSEAISLSTIGSGLKLFGDAAGAVPDIKSAWDDLFGRRELHDLMARDGGSEAISVGEVDDGVKLVTDAANAVPAIESAWKSVFGRGYVDLMAREHRMSPNERLQRLSGLQGKKHTGSGKMRKHPKSEHAATATHASMHARSPITEGEVDGGLELADDAFKAVPAIKNAWDSVFHRRFLDEMD